MFTVFVIVYNFLCYLFYDIVVLRYIEISNIVIVIRIVFATIIIPLNRRSSDSRQSTCVYMHTVYVLCPYMYYWRPTSHLGKFQMPVGISPNPLGIVRCFVLVGGFRVILFIIVILNVTVRVNGPYDRTTSRVAETNKSWDWGNYI